jgi:hypothetical protein
MLQKEGCFFAGSHLRTKGPAIARETRRKHCFALLWWPRRLPVYVRHMLRLIIYVTACVILFVTLPGGNGDQYVNDKTFHDVLLS